MLTKINAYIFVRDIPNKRMATFVPRLQPVLVEYTFEDVTESKMDRLPGQVENAIDSLVGRERLPSNENVIEFIHENSSNGEASSEEPRGVVRVQIMLPHEIALEVALDRSFNTEQPEHDIPLSTTDLRILTRRSVRTRLRTLRQRLRRENILPREYKTCIICMDQIRHNSNKITLECEHNFHRTCVVDWLAKIPRVCPSCRFDVDLSPRLDEEQLLATPRTRSAVDSEAEDVVIF